MDTHFFLNLQTIHLKTKFFDSFPVKIFWLRTKKGQRNYFEIFIMRRAHMIFLYFQFFLSDNLSKSS